ncbi:hypothetical protein LTR08_005278 [Meristemomyces frigidus]|nr:hypothetical protein LTR08_005278 [Meristemomyces frigidus]
MAQNGYNGGRNGEHNGGHTAAHTGGFIGGLHSAFNGGRNAHNGQFGLLPNHFPHGFQPDPLQYSANPNQHPLLNDTDSDMLNTFFDSEGKANNSFPEQNYSFGMDGEMDSNGDAMANPFGLMLPTASVNSVSTLAGVQGTKYSTHANNQPFHYPTNGMSDWAPDQTRRSSKDIIAGHALNQLSQSFGPAPTPSMGEFSGAAWGKMSLGAQIPPPHDSSESPASSSRNSAGDLFSPQYSQARVGYPAQVQMTQPQLEHFQQHMHPRAPHQSRGGNLGAAFSQSHFMPQVSQPTRSHTQRPTAAPFIQFGSDPHISSNGYRGPEYTPVQDKASNLLSVPLAEQVATNGHVRHPNQRTYHPQNTSHVSRAFRNTDTSPGAQYRGLSNTNPRMMANNQHRTQQHQPGRIQQARDTHGSHEEDDDIEDRQPRKRRRSQVQREDEADFQPERHMQSTTTKRGPKMPKAEGAFDDDDGPYTPVNQTSSRRRGPDDLTPAFGSRASNSPEDDDDDGSPSIAGESGSRKKRDSKSRANLSEDQKRQNHILSEQKRRNVIKQGYADLNTLVPNLGSGKSGLSKSEVLKEVVDYLESVIAGNKALMRMCGLAADDDDGDGVQGEEELDAADEEEVTEGY